MGVRVNLCLIRGALGVHAGTPETEQFFTGHELGEKIWFKPLTEKKIRSASQNRTYWMWITEIVQQSSQWDDKDDLHEEIKKRYVLPVLVRDDEDRAGILDAINATENEAEKEAKYHIFLKYAVTTQDLSVKQFAEVLDEISRAAIKRGIRLTDPEELKWQ